MNDQLVRVEIINKEKKVVCRRIKVFIYYFFYFEVKSCNVDFISVGYKWFEFSGLYVGIVDV